MSRKNSTPATPDNMIEYMQEFCEFVSKSRCTVCGGRFEPNCEGCDGHGFNPVTYNTAAKYARDVLRFMNHLHKTDPLVSFHFAGHLPIERINVRNLKIHIRGNQNMKVMDFLKNPWEASGLGATRQVM